MIPRFSWARPALYNPAAPPKSASLCRQQTRAASSVVKPVELHYDKVIPPDGNATDRPLVILHGLLYAFHCISFELRSRSRYRSGTKRNFGSLSKAFAKDLGQPVYTLVRCRSDRAHDPSSRAKQDLRNHGTSPHAEPHSYPAMATDVLHFFKTHQLSNISLLGHSM